MAETQPGGLYKVGDQLVDSEGKPTKRVKSADSKEPAKSNTSDELAADFPGREALAAAGLTTRAAVAAKSDEELDGIAGIGPATLKEIRAALK